jgi:predicted ATPase
MIQELYCKNFKVFREATSLPLRRLTVVTGPNNSGKSTIIDLFRLLDTEDANDGRILYSLKLDAGDHRLRTFSELLNDPNEPLEVGVKAFVNTGLEDLSSSDTTGDTDIYYDFALADDVQVHSRFESVEGRAFLKSRTLYLDPPEASEPQQVFRETHDLTRPGSDFGQNESQDTSNRTSQENKNVADGDGSPYEAMAEVSQGPPRPPVFATVQFGVDYGDGVVREDMTSPGLDRSMSRLAHTTSINFRQDYHERNRRVTWDIEPSLFDMAFKVLNYHSDLEDEASPRFSMEDIRHVCQRPSSLSPSLHHPRKGRREFPERSILPYFGEDAVSNMDDEDDVPKWLTPEGREAWQSALEEVIGPLVQQIDSRLSVDALHIPTYRGRPKRHYGPNDALTPLLQRFQKFEIKAEEMKEDVKEDYVGKWLEAFEIGSSLHVDTVGPDLYEAYVKRDGEKRYLADLGSGSAQLLPLIINFATQQSSLVVVEEPEANLHPNLQAQLADFFVEMMGRGIQVVIETHSEYLTRRLQYLVARGKCEPDHAGILYLRSEEDHADSEDTPKVQEITIDGYGQLSHPFGPGFFDQATNLMMDLFKYGQKN